MPLNLDAPTPEKMEEVKFIIITEENYEKVFEELRKNNTDPVLFGLTDDGYETLALNFAKTRKYIILNKNVLEKYKEYYRGSLKMSTENDLINNLAARFDTAIAKLSEVSISMDKMLAVHETRLEQQERQTEIIHDRIGDFKKEMMDELKELRNENKMAHQEVGERLSRLEKWRWMVVGASVVFGFLVAQMQVFSKIFS